ncbi:hypothetical protein SERIO_v1c09540 [Spiroplasma eriocheiris]|uniref:Uncharacterized protein n=2 Tax=Spiroplasma eriocheiris TaxID=315358 RepID=A0A0H3XN14_9MOLU|nr:hypothetical protein SPE_0953 [Spiroplasma eriocheiris CCTCC M 207170]AKM54512.1 hypothetical protein SERIO_v1c09540 [Spiroplasma eriocheiris]
MCAQEINEQLTLSELINLKIKITYFLCNYFEKKGLLVGVHFYEDQINTLIIEHFEEINPLLEQQFGVQYLIYCKMENLPK